jgi:nucleotide-binding universal stress UspA family protein
MFTHILLPTDGSAVSEATIKRGLEFARTLKASLTALHVIPQPQFAIYETEISAEVKDQAARQARQYSARILAAVEDSARAAGVPCETVTEVSDHPYEAIIAVAGRKGCDLIMMASHGRRGVRALLLGSETQKVLTHSKIPVLVFR